MGYISALTYYLLTENSVAGRSTNHTEQNPNNQDQNGLIDYRLIHGLVTYAVQVYRQETTMIPLIQHTITSMYINRF